MNRNRHDVEGLQRVLRVFERNYRLSSAAFYRAHTRNEPPATELMAWHREIWAGTYRQWLRTRPPQPIERPRQPAGHP